MSLLNTITKGSKQALFGYGIFPFLLATMLIWPLIGPLPYLPMPRIPLTLLIIAVAVFKGNLTIEKSVVLLLLYIPVEIMLSHPDPVFKSWGRYGLFGILMLFTSPLLQGSYIAKIRKGTMNTLLFYSTIVGLISFVCYFLGINYFISHWTGEAIGLESAGGFGGITRQSMILAPLSGIGTLYMLYRSFFVSKKTRKWYWLASIICLVVVFFAASRSALLATIAGGLVVLYQINQQRGGFVKTLLVLLVGGMFTLPLWENVASGILQKNEANQELGQFGSRQEKWTARWAEFKDHPLVGVGFAAQDPNGDDVYDEKTGTVEPGSSWLAILSMTGLIGLVIFLSIVIPPLKYLRTHRTPYNALMLGLLVFLFLHMIAEGYIFAGGSPLCFIAWLIIGCAFDQKYEYEDLNLPEDETGIL